MTRYGSWSRSRVFTQLMYVVCRRYDRVTQSIHATLAPRDVNPEPHDLLPPFHLLVPVLAFLVALTNSGLGPAGTCITRVHRWALHVLLGLCSLCIASKQQMGPTNSALKMAVSESGALMDGNDAMS